MRDWINTYGNSKLRMFQEGGAMAPPEGAPAGPPPEGGGGGGDIEAMLAEYAQTRDPQLAVAICDMLVEMMMGGGAEGGAPPPEGGPPAGPPPGGAPMGRKGMKLRRGPVFRK